MWNQRYQNEYDGWQNQRGDKQQYSKNSRDNWSHSSANFCANCGVPLNAFGNPQHSRHQHYQYDRKFNQSYQNGSSCSTMLVTLAVIVAFIIIIASCNVSSSSASPDLPVSQDMNIDYNSNITTTEAGNGAYPISWPGSLIEVNAQEVNQPSESILRTYVVKPGDTLYRIAVEILGDGSRWAEIDQLNNLGRLSNGSVLIHPGQVLILPDQ